MSGGGIRVGQALVDLLRVEAERLTDRDHLGSGRRVLISGQCRYDTPGQAEDDHDDKQQP
jgi:hypothetical protein